MSFPFDLHSSAVFDSHLPCRAHAIPDHALLLNATAQHGRRDTTCSRSAFSGYHAEFHEVVSDAYQSQMQVASVKPNTVCMDEEKSGSSTLQKRLSRTSSRIFPATTRTFTKDMALSEQGRGAAWHVRINTRHGRGEAWARHGRGTGTAHYV